MNTAQAQNSTAADTENLWARWAETGDEEVKKRIVLSYTGLVKFVISRMFSQLPPDFTYGDLENTGIIGLIDAVDRFEPERGLKFETFAVPRIRGAILDELRSYDFLPRSVRKKIRDVQNAVQRLEARLNRSPNEEEIAAELGLSVEKYRNLLKDVSPVRFCSLSDMLNGNVEGKQAHDAASAVVSGERTREMDRLEMKKTLLLSMQKLSKKERLTVALYYYEEMTMKEIAVVLKVSESRVSQIHTQALIKLRSSLAAGSE